MKTTAKISIIFIMTVTLFGCYKEVKFMKLEKVDLTAINEQVTVSIKIKNPNFYKIKIIKSDLNILVEDKQLGRIEGELDIDIPAKAETSIDLPVTVKLSDLIFSSTNIIGMLKNKDTRINIKGTITGKIFIFKKKIKIEEESKISLH